MQVEHLYQIGADIVLVTHVAIVLFVVGGFGFVLIGNRLAWQWVNHYWFRFVHVGVIAFVVLSTLLGFSCPLTTLESWLREMSGTGSYEVGFIEFWLRKLLFYQAATWVFETVYVLFGLLVVASWWIYPPRKKLFKA